MSAAHNVSGDTIEAPEVYDNYCTTCHQPDADKGCECSDVIDECERCGRLGESLQYIVRDDFWGQACELCIASYEEPPGL